MYDMFMRICLYTFLACDVFVITSITVRGEEYLEGRYGYVIVFGTILAIISLIVFLCMIAYKFLL